jgi:hypothetical protein
LSDERKFSDGKLFPDFEILGSTVRYPNRNMYRPGAVTCPTFSQVILSTFNRVAAATGFGVFPESPETGGTDGKGLQGGMFVFGKRLKVAQHRHSSDVLIRGKRANWFHRNAVRR